MNVIDCQNLTKRYGRRNALDHLTFSLGENKITGLIGRNGAGKSTLLNILAGYTAPTSGSIEVFSQNPFNNLMVSAHTILVDDRMPLPTNLNLQGLIDLARSFYSGWDQSFADRLMTYFSLEQGQMYLSLSKGMRSTFHMILGLASRSPLTLLDEPTNGMDVSVRKDFYRALLRDYLEHPRSIIISSHLLNELEDLLEDVLLIKEGELCLQASMDDLKEYAVGVEGPIETVQAWSQNREVLYRKEMQHGYGYAVVKSERDDFSQATKMGLHLSAVSAEDVCIYLTDSSKGGIDDVFNKR